MKPQSVNKVFRVALGSFVVAGMLAVMLLASLSTSWGIAYGQTVPTPGGTSTSPQSCSGTPGNPGGGNGGGSKTTPGSGSTTPGSGNGGGSNTSPNCSTPPSNVCTGNGGGNGNGNGSTTPGSGNGGGNTGGNNANPNCATGTTPPSAVDPSGKSPTKDPSAVGDANQGPVGVVPGLPHTGSQGPTDDNTWKYIVLGLLALNMLVAGVMMRRSSKSSRSR